MSQGWRNGLWIVLVCSSLACSKPDTPASNTAETGSGASGGLKLTPPAPGDADADADSGKARVTDKSGKAKATAGIDDTNPFNDAAKSSPIEEGAARKSLAGRWILVLTRSGQEGGFIDFHTGIVAISGSGAEAKVKWESPTEVLPPSKLTTSEVDGKQVHLAFDVNGTLLDFQGTLKNGIVYGNALFGNCLPARLLPTQEQSLEGFNVSPEPVDVRALTQAFNIQEPQAALKALTKFTTDRPESVLGMMAWESRVLVSAFEDSAPEQIEQLVADYDEAMAFWGPRLQQTGKGNLCIIFAQARYNPEFSLKFLSAADKAITDETLKDLKSQLKPVREAMLTAYHLKNLDSDDEARAEKAAAFLNKLRDKAPFDPTVLVGLANYHQKNKQIDEAIALYTEIAALPGLERSWAQTQKPTAEKIVTPSETLTKLWTAKHKNTDGLDEFKDEVYRRRIYAFADQPTTETPAAGNRLVLCELFTGSGCPPCVGADIATGALEVTYPKTQVIVLRYHQHIPTPDPLTNADSEDRFTNYYHGQSTPTVLLNGAPVNNTGGFLPNSPDIYRGLKNLVNQQLDSKATVQVGVNARVVDGTLQLVANVTGLDQLGDEAKDVRLRVVIAEDEVHFLARNGVRSHEMIARRMVGGPGGVEPKDGKLSIKDSIPLAELKSSLNDYLKKYEESEGIDFPAKPLDLKRLHVIAFVQNDESHEILQTSAIGVTAGVSTASNTITPASGKAAAKKTPVAE